MNRYQSREWQARLAFSLYGFAFPLKNPLRDSIEHLREGHQVGLVVGDLHVSIENCSQQHVPRSNGFL
jgi:hypothetical protein